MPPTLDDVVQQVARFAPGAPTTVPLDADLVQDLGYDSVRLVELFILVGDLYGIALPIEDILGGPALTVRMFAAHVVAT